MCRALALFIGISASILPATAAISGEDALKICRDHIRQDASARFGSPNIVFRTTNLTENEGGDDRISGTFLATGNGNSGIHKFDCSVEVDNAILRWARIDARSNAAAPSAAASPVPANGADNTDAELTDKCRDVVRHRIYDHGYIRTKFNKLVPGNGQGPTYLVTGKATGETGGHEAVFEFSCEVNRATGAVGSVELKPR